MKLKLRKTQLMFDNLSRIVIIFFMILFVKNANAQDPSFSQFYANPLYLNPAFAGSNECPRANLNYRDQWPGIDRTYVTTSASWDMHINAIGGGIGVLVAQDKAGDGNLNTTHASLQYSYRLKVSNEFAVKAGFEASYRMIDLNWNGMTFGDMIHPQYGFIYDTQEDLGNNPENKGFVDFAAGILGYSENLFFGVAMHHLTMPNQGLISESKLPSRLTTHAGGNIVINKFSNSPLTISPNFLYQKQAQFQQFNYGIYVKKGPVVGGVWTRNSLKNFDSMIVMMGLIQETFKFGYSYDITISNLGNDNTLGAHELSFTLFMPCSNRTKSYKTINCPQF